MNSKVFECRQQTVPDRQVSILILKILDQSERVVLFCTKDIMNKNFHR